LPTRIHPAKRENTHEDRYHKTGGQIPGVLESEESDRFCRNISPPKEIYKTLAPEAIAALKKPEGKPDKIDVDDLRDKAPVDGGEGDDGEHPESDSDEADDDGNEKGKGSCRPPGSNPVKRCNAVSFAWDPLASGPRFTWALQG
jgi:hypothetical protein